MESKIKLKVVKSGRLSSKKNEDRYVIIDEITGMAVDNAGGHGYKSVEGALAHYRYKWKCGNTLKVRPTVNTWFIEHKDFFDQKASLKPTVFSSRYLARGRNAIN